jgi:hypothetical protein
MTTQLLLLDDSDHEWRLDPETRETGRRGIAQARAVLRSVPRRHADASDVAADHTAVPSRRPIAA